MGYILHLSDFHYGVNCCTEIEHLASLASWLKEQKFDVRYVVFTGDAIDASVITQEAVAKLYTKHSRIFDGYTLDMFHKERDGFLNCICRADQSIINEYNETIKEISNQRINEIAGWIEEFLNSINVPCEHFVACCGNHDRIRFLSKDAVEFSCDVNHRIDETALSSEYEPYVKFCERINKRLTYKTDTYSIDGLNFVIANSNWRTPTADETNNMCIHCSAVMSSLEQLERSENFQRNHNFFVAHKPFDDFCESAKFPYKNEMITMREMIERTTAAFFHGDKHSYTIKAHNRLREYMCGLPLRGDSIRYNLIEYDNDQGVLATKLVTYSKGDWVLVPINDCMDAVYQTSKNAIKRYAIKLLSGNIALPTKWSDAIKMVQNAEKNGTLDLVQQLFGSCGTIYDENQKKLSYKKNTIFSFIQMCIKNSVEHRVLCIKGEPGTGKSTFLSIMYLYLLRMFYAGEFPYMPFYFDFDNLVKTETIRLDEEAHYDIGKIIEFYCNQFEAYLDACLKVRGDYGLPICIVVDGLDTRNMLIYDDMTLEEHIYTLLETKLRDKHSKYIMGLNTHDNVSFEESFEQQKWFHYALFFNHIYIVPYKNINRCDDFLDAYIKLNNLTDDAKRAFLNTLKKMRKIAIDLNYLYSNNDILQKNNDSEDSWRIMKEQVHQSMTRAERLFEITDVVRGNTIYRAAYELLMAGNAYQYIIGEEGMSQFTYTDYVKIRNNPEMAKLLIARHYLEELKEYASARGKEKDIPSKSILYSFIPRDIAVLMRVLMDIRSIQLPVFERFLNGHRTNLSGYLRSMLTYLIGHHRNDNSNRLLKMLVENDNTQNEFYKYCNRRSFELARIVSEYDPELVSDFICNLMDEEEYRLFNRSYNLRYYQDINDVFEKIWEPWSIKKSRKKGFDFHNCFLVLDAKLRYCFENNHPYPMMEIDLYTICDLIYSRLQDSRSEKSLFYSGNYNDADNSVVVAILQETVRLINLYFDRYGENQDSRGINTRVLVYYKYLRARFESIAETLGKNPGKVVDAPFVSQSYEYKKILRLSNRPRVGWNINNPNEVTVDMRPQYSAESITGMPEVNWDPFPQVFETIGQHILESVYIAQLFLPESLQYPGYQKAKVISMLLMSEIGKINTGDYSPEDVEANRSLVSNEKKGRDEILTLGTFDGYANFNGLFGPLRGIDMMNTDSIDVNARICQEIKLIQMEYKYYTLFNKLEFQPARQTAFKKEFVDPQTPICKDIRKRLILMNPDFEKSFEQ